MPLRCVIVDDNPDFLLAASDLLQHEGISVVGAVSTGAQAHRACREQQPDVVLIDVDLGEETGFDVARRLAAEPATERSRIVLISAHCADEFDDMIADSPAVGFLPKTGLSAATVQAVLTGSGG